MSKNILLCLGALMFMGVAASYGQVNTTEGAQVAGHGRVNKVDKEQQEAKQGIAEGQQSGKLSESEAAELKRKEAQIQSEKTQDMMKHHGHLRKGEAKKLEREEKDLNKDIKKDAAH